MQNLYALDKAQPYLNMPQSVNKAYKASVVFQNDVIQRLKKRVEAFSRFSIKLQGKLGYINPEAALTLSQKTVQITDQLNHVIAQIQAVHQDVGAHMEQVRAYAGKVDSFKTALVFLGTCSNNFSKGTLDSLKKISAFYSLGGGVDLTEQIHEAYKLMGQLAAKYGISIAGTQLSKEFVRINSLNETMTSFADNPDKAVKHLVSIAQQHPQFAAFFARNSEMASLFGLGAESVGNTGSSVSNFSGLQAREPLSQLLSQRGLSMPSLIQGTSAPDLSSTLESFKQRLIQLGQEGNQDLFISADKLNIQRKKFLQRFEVGTNFQTTRSRYGFPARADIGLSLGYRFTKNTIAGIGIAYKLGLGENISKIRLSNEGIELRSFIDIKVKKSFWATAGYELHHYKAFRSLADIGRKNLWQQSCLIGISKKISLGGKKSSKMQVLWEPLAIPASSLNAPLKFRIGYQL